MSTPSQSKVAGLGRFVSNRVFQLLVLVVLGLVLYGTVPRARLAWVLGMFVLARGLFLLAEGRRRRVTPAEWQSLQAEYFGEFTRLSPEESAEDALLFGLEPAAPPEELARAAVAELRSRHVPPRSGRELLCEGLGVLTFGVLLPAAAILFTHDFVSLRGSQGWVGLGVAGVSLALYAWPLLWGRSVRLSQRRMLWWALPFVPALALLMAGIGFRHPYLDPTREDRVRLAADRVLALEDIVMAGAHADWVFAYADQLERQGDREQATRLYRAGLRLAPTNREAHAHLALLETRRSTRRQGVSAPSGFRSPEERARAPLWNEGEVASRRPPCEADETLERVDGTVVVLVRVGDVPNGLVDPVGEVIERELGIPTCVARQTVPLPAHSRVRGLVVGRQWSLKSLARAFLYQVQELPTSPAKFVLLTNADVYNGDANFLFSGTYAWGAIVSFARYGEGPPESLEIVRRTAKQTLGALLQSFGLPKSTDPHCVTSYSNGLPQFEAKGNRPNAETLALFQRALRNRNEKWTAHKTAALGEGR